MPTGINWQDLKTIAELQGIKLGSTMLKRIKVAEEMTMREYSNAVARGK